MASVCRADRLHGSSKKTWFQKKAWLIKRDTIDQFTVRRVMGQENQVCERTKSEKRREQRD